ncbi:formin-like protein [Actinidia rufa]|uniref:Formin-like protein n=1 Tax=Actinidia rufa TaxID=165716 RepID=A0A7J0GQ32_9ERIC|nr:formin-like protein [Actinidia rufa]
MASGSSGRNNSGSKGFDFATDDILCSYEDYENQESSNGGHSDPVIGSNPNKVVCFYGRNWLHFRSNGLIVA